jgi:hypothetical protein
MTHDHYVALPCVSIFDPLLASLGDRKRLLLAPDGDLTRLPFEVLPMDDGRRLIDEYYISYLSTGRAVLHFGAASSGQSTTPVVAAAPDFDLRDLAINGYADTEMRSTQSQVPPQPKQGLWSRLFCRRVLLPPPQPEQKSQEQVRSASTATSSYPSRQSRDLERGKLHFGQLLGTRREGEQSATMLEVQSWLEDTALEARLKACRSPRILHIATHGFFLADQQRDPNKEMRDLGVLSWQLGDGMSRLSGPGLENPMLRSGLALAGANTWLKEGPLPLEAEDGILTAEDVSGLDLPGY